MRTQSIFRGGAGSDQNELNRPERRQYFGESATVALAEHLKRYAQDGVVPCEAVSRIDEPGDLADTYGRIVANIRFGKRYGEDVNLWLARRCRNGEGAGPSLVERPDVRVLAVTSK